MGGNYEKNMYNQLCELMEKVNSLESAHKEDRKEINRLNCRVDSLTKENQQLRATVKAQKQELEQLHLTCEILQKESVIETIKRRKIGIFNGIKDMFEVRPVVI